MIKKIKSLLITGAVVAFVFAVIIAIYFKGKYTAESLENERLLDNQEQLLTKADFILLRQSMEEFKATIPFKIDSILKSEKIKLKNIERVIERHLIFRDTTYASHTPTPVNSADGRIYPFEDTNKCFEIKGFMMVTGTQPSLTITDRKFENSSIDISYIKRSKRFLGIAYGRWKAKLKSINQCGETTVKEIEIIKE